MQMFLLAEMVKANEALRIGLVDKIAEDLVADALRISHALAALEK
jgi:enoyl-CoA hydratase/carnithine racemase